MPENFIYRKATEVGDLVFSLLHRLISGCGVRHAEIVYVPCLMPLVPFINESMYFIWWRRWKRFLEICYLWWNKFVLLVCLCSHSKWWNSGCVCVRAIFRMLRVLFSLATMASLSLVRSLNSCAFDSVFGSQNINKTFSTFCRLNGSAFIFIFVYRFGSLAMQHPSESRTKKSIQIVGEMRLKPKHHHHQQQRTRKKNMADINNRFSFVLNEEASNKNAH